MAPKLWRLPSSWAEEIHLQSRYPRGISVTNGGAGCPSAWPGAGEMRETRPAIVATATKKNVKFLTVFLHSTCFAKLPTIYHPRQRLHHVSPPNRDRE